MLGSAVIALGGLVVARRLLAERPGQMPHLGLLRRAMIEKRGEEEAARLIARVQARYDELCASAPHLENRALRIHLRWNILPGLALYQTLLEEGMDRQAALAEVEDLVARTSAGIRRLVALLSRLPRPFTVLRWTQRWVVRLGFPPEGWDMEPVEDSDHCVAFNVRRCFYLDTFSSHGVPELTAAYCAGDDVAFAALPPSIAWERTMTMGRGNEYCNFRWRRVEPSQTVSRESSRSEGCSGT